MLSNKRGSWRDFLAVDFKDIWNWILLVLAIALLWWGLSSLMKWFKF